MKIIFSILILLGLAGAGDYYYVRYYRVEGTSNFKTAQVERGNMLPTIEATGTVEPEQVVDIGSQVNGLITHLLVDYGSNVEEKEILATVDDSIYKATADQNEAAVNSAKANLLLGKANQSLAQANLHRDEVLRKTPGALPDAQYDTDFAACEVAKATVGVDEAAIKQYEATLRQSLVNLGYCNIRSPVKGTIVDRRVNVGQTVVSSLSASSLFLLAKDLSRIQVWASVNEADIGRIHEHLKVSFKVDAYPNEKFVGEVLQIRLNATMTQNVVTYTVVVTTENPLIEALAGDAANKDSPGPYLNKIETRGPHYKLLPYMTASLLFETARHENVLKVPNAALRWKPAAKQIAPDIRAETLAAMNRPKRADDNQDEGEAKPAAQRAEDRGERPKQSSAATPAAQDSALATTGGSATGLKPKDWEARTKKKAATEKNAGAAKTAGAGNMAMPEKAAGARTKGGTPAAGKGQPPGRPITATEAKAHKERHETGRLWIADPNDKNYVRPVHVRIIATDGTMTEVEGKDVSDGMEIVIGENIAAETDSDTTNPFMPKLMKGKSGSSKSKDAPSK